MGVLEPERILTSCNPFHNQDLYKYSVLPLSLCRIVIAVHSVMLLAICYIRSCILLCLFLCMTLFLLLTAVLPL